MALFAPKPKNKRVKLEPGEEDALAGTHSGNKACGDEAYSDEARSNKAYSDEARDDEAL